MEKEEKNRNKKLGLYDSVRKWYMKAYPSDELGQELTGVTFKGVINSLPKGKFYKTMGPADSIIRERIFEEISKRTHTSYEDVYTAWLHYKPLHY